MIRSGNADSAKSAQSSLSEQQRRGWGRRKEERKFRHACTQENLAKEKMKGQIEIYILAGGRACCQRERLKCTMGPNTSGAEGCSREQ